MTNKCTVCNSPISDSNAIFCSECEKDYWMDPAGGIHPITIEPPIDDNENDFYDPASLYE